MQRLIAAALFALFASMGTAQAAKCSVGEYNAAGFASGVPIQVAGEPHITTQVVDFSGGVASSAAFNAATQFIRLWCDTQASYLVGTAPTAATTDNGVAALVPEYFSVPTNGGYKISVIARP
jgi:hypothetical protein